MSYVRNSVSINCKHTWIQFPALLLYCTCDISALETLDNATTLRVAESSMRERQRKLTCLISGGDSFSIDLRGSLT